MEAKKTLNSLHQIRQERARTFRTVLIQTVASHTNATLSI
jgi:hypothetical protein